MSHASITVRRSLAAIVAVALVLTGASATWVWTRQRAAGSEELPPPAAPAVTPPPAAGERAGVSVSLTQEAMTRAGVRVAEVSRPSGIPTLRAPGVVEANGYRTVVVTPLVAGRVMRVLAELGDVVRAGRTIAEIYSPAIAEAQAAFFSARATLEAHTLELSRTQRLVEIGASSQRELEQVQAEHTARATDVESARARLELLGVAPRPDDRSAVLAVADVPAPVEGTVIERTANVGLNVDLASALFTIADLSTVWVVAEIYEQDLHRVRLGAKAEVTVPGTPGRLEGRVSYIDPQVTASTRTGRLRIELPNPAQALRLGMFVDVVLDGPASAAAPDGGVAIPRTAVQTIGDRTVVYVEDPAVATRFHERAVRLGPASGALVPVIDGLAPGERIVVEGSFPVRAEIERLGLRPPGGDAPPRTAEVLVTDKGFEPASLVLPAGLPARITFRRTTDQTCAREVVFPSLGLRRALPLNEAVEVAVTPVRPQVEFLCGMNMLKGAVVAR